MREEQGNREEALEKHTNNFDAPLKGFMIGLGAHKGWKEGMVDIDGVVSMLPTEFL